MPCDVMVIPLWRHRHNCGPDVLDGMHVYGRSGYDTKAFSLYVSSSHVCLASARRFEPLSRVVPARKWQLPPTFARHRTRVLASYTLFQVLCTIQTVLWFSFYLVTFRPLGRLTLTGQITLMKLCYRPVNQ